MSKEKEVVEGVTDWLKSSITQPIYWVKDKENVFDGMSKRLYLASQILPTVIETTRVHGDPGYAVRITYEYVEELLKQENI